MTGRLKFRWLATGLLLRWILSASGMTYVAVDGWHTYPFDTWSKAATNLQAAIDAAGAGGTVLVSNGVYTASGTEVVLISNAVALISVNGPEVTEIDAQGTGSTERRGITLTGGGSGALVAGFTIRGADRSTHSYNGGGVYMAAGTVSNCVIRDNRVGGRGGGIYMTGGTVVDSLLTGNRSTEWNYAYGGAIYMNGGLVRNTSVVSNWTEGRQGGGGVNINNGTLLNCLITRNESRRFADNALGPGGGVRMTGGRMIHCTVADNWSRGSGGGVRISGGTITNSIIYHNLNSSENLSVHHNIYQTGGTIHFSLTSPLPAGVGNLDGDPSFADRAAGVYRLMPGSVAMDAGINLSGVSVDYDYAPRPVDGRADGSVVADMGAYESPVGASGGLRCDFTADTNAYIGALEVTFQAVARGAETGGLHFAWDFNQGGSQPMTAAGADRDVVTTNFAPGWYTVALTVSNEHDAAAVREREAFIRVAPEIVYVATNGNDQLPFGSWSAAATNPADAVAVAYADGATASVVRVAAGTYGLPATIGVQHGIRIESVDGASNTFLRSDGNYRCFDISHPDAVVDGFSLQGPNWSYIYYWGGAVRIRAGRLMHSIVHETRIGSRGGGIYINGGTVSHCQILNNWVHEWNYGYGGGVYMESGLLEYSLLQGNYTTSRQGGGAIYMTGGRVRNCLIVGNEGRYASSPNFSPGGGVRMSGGLIESTTLADNFAEGPGGGIYMTGGAATNTIVYHNTVNARNPDSQRNIYRSAGNVTWSCATPLESGSGNIDVDPDFLDRAGNDYRIPRSSSCADAGMTQAWMTNALDFGGDPRIRNENVDIGAYEAPDFFSGALGINFTASETAGFDQLETVFTASAVGVNRELNWFHWDFNVDGESVMTRTGTNLWVVTNSFSAGYYSVGLWVSNTIQEAASVVKSDYVKVVPAVLYVADDGTAVAPYTTRETATPFLQDAINAASAGEGGQFSEIRVASGVYTVSTAIAVAKPVAIRSSENAVSTIFRSSGPARVFELNDADAVLDGLTIEGCNNSGVWFNGGGVYMTAGLVTNCVIRNNHAGGRGGGIWQGGGLVTDTLFVSNRVSEWQYGYGGGLFIQGGRAQNCVFDSNWTTSWQGGGGIYINGGTVRNCLLLRNRATRTIAGSEGRGGGAVLAAGRLENSTVVSNWSIINGGGILMTGGAMTNTIVYDNWVTDSGADNLDTSGNVAYSCSPDLVHNPDGTGNITNAPGFIDAAAGDYRLAHGSPCIDTGINAPWMTTARDLDGGPRVVKGALHKPMAMDQWRVDIGAYEYRPPDKGILFQLR